MTAPPGCRFICRWSPLQEVAQGITQVTPTNAMLPAQTPARKTSPDLPACYLQPFVCLAHPRLTLQHCLGSLPALQTPPQTPGAPRCPSPNHSLGSVCCELLFAFDRTRVGKQLLHPKKSPRCFSMLVIKVCLLYCQEQSPNFPVPALFIKNSQ